MVRYSTIVVIIGDLWGFGFRGLGFQNMFHVGLSREQVLGNFAGPDLELQALTQWGALMNRNGC